MQNRFHSLPLEIQRHVYELDPTYRELFDAVVVEMKRLLSTNEELEFKKKYQRFFGCDTYAHVGGPTSYDTYRVASISMYGDWSTNSIEFPARKVFMYMQLMIPGFGVPPNFYDRHP